MPKRKRILSLISCSLILFGMSGCSISETQDMLNSGAGNYGSGRTEENYYFKNSGALLQELIDKYSGSYYQPTGTSMTDDEHDDAKKAQGTSESSEDPSDSGADPGVPAAVPEVSSMTELMRVFHDAYDRTAESVEFKTVGGFTFDMHTDLQAIYTALQREDPIDVSGVASWSTWSNGNEYYVSVSYAFGVSGLKSMKLNTVNLVADAVKKIGADGLSDYEKVVAVNDYLCDSVYYPPTEPYAPITHTAYGALKDGCAVCEGYACAAKLLLNGMGVECDIEVGDCLNGGGHAWNLVKLDGDWYQLDVTWNDGSSARTDYFLVTDDFMKQSRKWDENNYPVSAKTPYTVN